MYLIPNPDDQFRILSRFFWNTWILNAIDWKLSYYEWNQNAILLGRPGMHTKNDILLIQQPCIRIHTHNWACCYQTGNNCWIYPVVSLYAGGGGDTAQSSGGEARQGGGIAYSPVAGVWRGGCGGRRAGQCPETCSCMPRVLIRILVVHTLSTSIFVKSVNAAEKRQTV